MELQRVVPRQHGNFGNFDKLDTCKKKTTMMQTKISGGKRS